MELSKVFDYLKENLTVKVTTQESCDYYSKYTNVIVKVMLTDPETREQVTISTSSDSIYND